MGEFFVQMSAMERPQCTTASHHNPHYQHRHYHIWMIIKTRPEGEGWVGSGRGIYGWRGNLLNCIRGSLLGVTIRESVCILSTFSTMTQWPRGGFSCRLLAPVTDDYASRCGKSMTESNRFVIEPNNGLPLSRDWPCLSILGSSRSIQLQIFA